MIPDSLIADVTRYSKAWNNLQFPADLVTFTEENRNRKLHFLCSEIFAIS